MKWDGMGWAPFRTRHYTKRDIVLVLPSAHNITFSKAVTTFNVPHDRQQPQACPKRRILKFDWHFYPTRYFHFDPWGARYPVYLSFPRTKSSLVLMLLLRTCLLRTPRYRVLNVDRFDCGSTSKPNAAAWYYIREGPCTRKTKYRKVSAVSCWVPLLPK